MVIGDHDGGDGSRQGVDEEVVPHENAQSAQVDTNEPVAPNEGAQGSDGSGNPPRVPQNAQEPPHTFEGKGSNEGATVCDAPPVYRLAHGDGRDGVEERGWKERSNQVLMLPVSCGGGKPPRMPKRVASKARADRVVLQKERTNDDVRREEERLERAEKERLARAEKLLCKDRRVFHLFEDEELMDGAEEDVPKEGADDCERKKEEPCCPPPQRSNGRKSRWEHETARISPQEGEVDEIQRLTMQVRSGVPFPRQVSPPRICGFIDENEEFQYDPAILRVKCRHCKVFFPFRPVEIIIDHEELCFQRCRPCHGIFPKPKKKKKCPEKENKPPTYPSSPSSNSNYGVPRTEEWVQRKPIYCLAEPMNIDQQLCIDIRTLSWKEFYEIYVTKTRQRYVKPRTYYLRNSDVDMSADEEPDGCASVQLWEIQGHRWRGNVYRNLFFDDGKPAYGIKRNCLVYLVKLLPRYYYDAKNLDNLYIVLMMVIALYKPRTDWALEALRKRFTPKDVKGNRAIKRIYILLADMLYYGRATEIDNLAKGLKDPQREDKLHPANLLTIQEPPAFEPLFTEYNIVEDDDDFHTEEENEKDEKKMTELCKKYEQKMLELRLLELEMKELREDNYKHFYLE